MTTYRYTITSLVAIAEGIYQLIITPMEGDVFPFTAGQFVQVWYDRSPTPAVAHLFSIASAPSNKKTLELCFRVYGPWTTSLSKAAPGATLTIGGPLGKFIWDTSITRAVFLAGGIGIVPILSILRQQTHAKQYPKISLVYGNRTPQSIVYAKAITACITANPNAELQWVFSDLTEPPHDFPGSKTGFVTPEIITSTKAFSATAIFFVCGPPPFVLLMKQYLTQLAIPVVQMKEELYSVPPQPRR